MKHLSNIDTATAIATPASGAGGSGPSSPAPLPRPAEIEVEAPAPAPAEVTEKSRENYEEAISAMQDSLDAGPGPRRDVTLEYRDGRYIVEIRRRKDGALIQVFPPEKLLNLGDWNADHLGTVIDRQG